VNRRGDELLAGTGFAMDEHCGAAPRDLRDVLHQPLHGGMLAQNFAELKPFIHTLTELGCFPRESRSF